VLNIFTFLLKIVNKIKKKRFSSKKVTSKLKELLLLYYQKHRAGLCG